MNDQQNQMNPQEQTPDPSVSGVFGHGWEILKKFFPELLLVIFLQMLISIPISLGNVFNDRESFGSGFFGLFAIVYALLVMAPVSYGSSWIFLKAVRGESFRPQDMFFAFQQIGQIILANILVGLIVGLGILFLIIPGIIFACKLAFVPYLIMDEKLDAAEAIRKSWAMTKGHSGTIFLIGITSFFVALAGIICLIVGIFPAIIWISLAFAGIYWSVSLKQKG